MRLVVFLFFLCALPPAIAQNPSQRAYKEASSAFQSKEYQRALTLFLRVHEETKDPNLLFNIAQCHRKLSDPKSAVDFYERFLAEVPNTPLKAEIQKLIKEERAKLPPEIPKPTSIAVELPPASTPTREDVASAPTPEKKNVKPFLVPVAFFVSAATTGSIALGLSQRFQEEGFPEERIKGRTPGQILAVTCDLSLVATVVGSFWATRTYRKSKEVTQ